jgi:hypothetical protein
MGLEEFSEAEVEEGFRSERASGVVEVTEGPNDPHGEIALKLLSIIAIDQRSSRERSTSRHPSAIGGRHARTFTSRPGSVVVRRARPQSREATTRAFAWTSTTCPSPTPARRSRAPSTKEFAARQEAPRTSPAAKPQGGPG